MSTGLLFGTFDPFHLGHYNMCIQALNSKLVDKIIIIPAYQNPWKESPSADFFQRISLIELVLNDHYAWAKYKILVSGIEMDVATKLGTEKVNTCDVLDLIKEVDEKTASDYWIITSDESLLGMLDWKRGEEILENNKFIIIPRDSSFLDPKIPFKHIYKWKIIDGVYSNISSTYIRDLIKQDLLPIPWITENQYNYILRNNLYK